MASYYCITNTDGGQFFVDCISNKQRPRFASRAPHENRVTTRLCLAALSSTGAAATINGTEFFASIPSSWLPPAAGRRGATALGDSDEACYFRGLVRQVAVESRDDPDPGVLGRLGESALNANSKPARKLPDALSHALNPAL